ncbi:hybrid sensor histidine kinase/response regulator [Robertmurraya korlensis]|uniref:hybrid sensor histidine kinase/response regulator n=1 Tax=Robertmurraya korlensis TaxID=519977 RepID=UPI000824C70A|nr:ATP-binding protein [Robertmurraya korlensis]
MKDSSNKKQRLIKQFIQLMILFLSLFLIGTSLYLYLQHKGSNDYVEKRALIVNKEKTTRDLYYSLNTALFDVRGYFAFGNEELKKRALSQQPEIRKLAKKLDASVTNDEDTEYVRELESFVDYYFVETLPQAVQYYETGRQEDLINLAQLGATARTNEFLDLTHEYMDVIDNELNRAINDMRRNQTIYQNVYLAFVIFLLAFLFRIIRGMFTNIGAPLSELAKTATDITEGKDSEIFVDPHRKDEIGALSLALKKMLLSIQEKEQNLLAQNEELLAQQDELYAQQSELENALYVVNESKHKIENRNELTNKLTNALEKQKLLDSIVLHMTRIIKADRGLIILLDDQAHSSYGISPSGIEQFKKNIYNGLNSILIVHQQPYTIKREIKEPEKGYHEGTLYSYDLYLPVISSNDVVTAIMVFSRFGNAFTESEIEELQSITKQMSNSLEKVYIYELSETERLRNQSILNTTHEGIQLIDRDGVVLLVNKALCEMFECVVDGRDLVGLDLQDWTTFMQKDIEEQDEFLQFVQSAIENNHVNNSNSFIYKRLDKHQVIKVYSEALFQDDIRIGTIIVHRDITKEFEVDQMKSEFVSTVSHELRTPLASILGFTELMLHRELKPDRQQKYLTTVYNEAKRLTALINDFLDVQRMEAGKHTYEKKYFELLPIVESVTHSLRGTTKIHDINVTTKLENDWILGDREKIEQVLTNLVGNAIKYSPEGGKVQLLLFEEDGELKVRISDEGLGIPENVGQSIFTKFYRVDNSDRRKIGGTGLGLAIVKEIMSAHDGDVTYTSEYGKGSTFTISFPIVKKEVSSTADTNDIEASTYKVFVIEDDESLLDLVSQELLDNGFTVTQFTNGEHAVEALKKEVPDAVVLDIMLDKGNVDGWDIMRFIKEKKELMQIPVIISSALDERDKGIANGAEEYFIKPYKTSKLSKIVMQLLLKLGKEGQVIVPFVEGQDTER